MIGRDEEAETRRAAMLGVVQGFQALPRRQQKHALALMHSAFLELAAPDLCPGYLATTPAAATMQSTEPATVALNAWATPIFAPTDLPTNAVAYVPTTPAGLGGDTHPIGAARRPLGGKAPARKPAAGTRTAALVQLPQIVSFEDSMEPLDVVHRKLGCLLEFSWSSDFSEPVDGVLELVPSPISKLPESSFRREFMDGLHTLCEGSVATGESWDPLVAKIWMRYKAGVETEDPHVLALLGSESDAARVLEAYLQRSKNPDMPAMRIREQIVHVSPPTVPPEKKLPSSSSPRWADVSEYSDTESTGTQGMSEITVETPAEVNPPLMPMRLQVRGIPYQNWYNGDLLKQALEIIDSFIHEIVRSISIDTTTVSWTLDVKDPLEAPPGSCWVNFASPEEDPQRRAALLGSVVAGAKAIQHGSQPFKIDKLRLFVRFPPGYGGELPQKRH
mmetsp:Transcript_128557/g.363819  ORF Transcript_128557/g.363819 Transcript_128557/m.363819 type:complete len:447 (+) Transcript_128557:68-1408(+)